MLDSAAGSIPRRSSATFFALVVASIPLLTACGPTETAAPDGTVAFVGARLVDGTGAAPLEDAVLVVRDGRIVSVGPSSSVDVPGGAERVDLGGSTVVPGLINTHGHVGRTADGLSEAEAEQAIRDELRLYALYGVTTVNSLGGDSEASMRVRDAQASSDLDYARLRIAGPVIAGSTPDEVRAEVAANSELSPDWLKLRVDDNLGTSPKMSPEVYRTVIDEAHRLGVPLAAHLFYLEDAKELLRAEADFLAHSVRDSELDDEFLRLVTEADVCYCPTLTREVSTFVYGERPDFFDDPFFLRHADMEEVELLSDEERQVGVRESRSAQLYREALDVALQNVKAAADAGVTVAFGTDTGPLGRFQGFFEHMEMDLMARAGLSPAQILASATGDAARCLGLEDVGTLEPGNWADFIVLDEDPLADIANMRTLSSVWVAGNRVTDGA